MTDVEIGLLVTLAVAGLMVVAIVLFTLNNGD